MSELERIIKDLRDRYEALKPYVEEANAIQSAVMNLEQAQHMLTLRPTGSASIALLDATGANNGSGKPTIADLAEKVLRENGGALRASEVLKRLNAQGYKISQPVLASAIMRYVRKNKRFSRPQPGVYALMGANAPAVRTVLEQHGMANVALRGKPVGLRTLVLNMLSELPPQFTRLDILARLKEIAPQRATTTQASAMRALLYNLVRDGRIEVLKPGSTREPSVYRARAQPQT